MQALITELLEIHHCLRLTTKIVTDRIENGFATAEVPLPQLKCKLAESSRQIEDTVSSLQANIPYLNEAKKALCSNCLVLSSELEWMENFENCLQDVAQEITNFDGYSARFDKLNVSKKNFVSTNYAWQKNSTETRT